RLFYATDTQFLGWSDTMETIGFIGLGHMGAPMAACVQKGYHLVVMDTNPAVGGSLLANGARRVQDVADVADAARTILLSLPGPNEVRPVVTGLAPWLREDDVVIDLSTCTPPLA